MPVPQKKFTLCGTGILPVATPVPLEEYGIIEPRRREGHEGREKKK